MWRRFLPALALLLPASLLSGCAQSEHPEVVASFYPLQYVADRVLGDSSEVANLTPPGVEPHDYELKPRQIAAIDEALVVFYEKGLQPAVDEAISNESPDNVVDAAHVVGLRHGDGGLDPHFWQDPTLLAKAADAFTTAISKAEPKRADEFRRNNEALQRDLTALDREISAGLRTCRTHALVVSHDAFEYFGRRYGLDVYPIAGLSPDAEPSAKHLAELADLAKDKGVTTIFSERLASPKLAETLASEVGVENAVLDPIEGLSSSDPKADYLSLMRSNLAAVQKAGGCS